MSPVAPAQPRRILIIKPSSLGDVVTALPVLRAMRRQFPSAHIAWLVSTACRPLIDGDGDISEIIPFDRAAMGRAWRSPRACAQLVRFMRQLRQVEFDWTIDLQGLLRSGIFAAATRAPIRAGFADARECAAVFYNRRIAVTAQHTVDRNIELAAALGVHATPQDMTLQVPPGGREFAESFCRSRGLAGKDFVVCVPSTRWPTKVYPTRHWRTLAALLAKDTRLVIIGTAGEQAAAQAIAQNAGDRAINMVGQTSIPQMVGLIAASAGVICSDSAAKFIAPAVGVPAVTLIGPTRLDRTGPYLKGTAVVAPVPCQGCLRRACRHITCMELIDPAVVAQEARKMLSP